MSERCPTCGRPMSKKGYRLLTGTVIGVIAGVILAHLLVAYYFGGGYTHPMAIIHYIAGVFLGGLIGTTAAFFFRR